MVTIAPGFTVGARVIFLTRAGRIVRCDPSNRIPRRVGETLVLYTHTYTVELDDGRTIHGLVESDLRQEAPRA